MSSGKNQNPNGNKDADETRLHDLYLRFDLEATRRERDYLRDYINKLLDDIDKNKKG